MNLKIESNAFTKLDEMVGILKVNILLGNYQFEDKILKGNVIIKGEYYSSDERYAEQNGLGEFENSIPYEIVFTKDHPNINSIEITNFEYYEVAGRGIESTFSIDVDYEITIDEVENNPSLVEENIDENIEKDMYELKEEITSRIDDILTEKIEVVDDNFLEEEPLIEPKEPEIRNIDIKNISSNKQATKKDQSSVIKVIYYKDGDGVKELCKKHNLSYDQVLEENQKYDFHSSHRIIVSEANGSN